MDAEHYGYGKIRGAPKTYYVPLHHSGLAISQQLERRKRAFELMIDETKEYITVGAGDAIAVRLCEGFGCKTGGPAQALNGGLIGVALADKVRGLFRR